MRVSVHQLSLSPLIHAHLFSSHFLTRAAAAQASLELDEKAEAAYYKLEHRLKIQLGLIEEDEAEAEKRR